MGRPSEYSAETAERICELLAEGQSLRQVCKASDMPDRNTVMRWMEANADFAAKYARARDIGLDERADALREEILTEEDAAKARLILDHGKWYLSKLAPKKYGDKLAIDGDGAGGAIPIALKVQFE